MYISSFELTASITGKLEKYRLVKIEMSIGYCFQSYFIACKGILDSSDIWKSDRVHQTSDIIKFFAIKFNNSQQNTQAICNAGVFCGFWRVWVFTLSTVNFLMSFDIWMLMWNVFLIYFPCLSVATFYIYPWVTTVHPFKEWMALPYSICGYLHSLCIF